MKGRGWKGEWMGDRDWGWGWDWDWGWGMGRLLLGWGVMIVAQGSHGSVGACDGIALRAVLIGGQG